MKRKDLTRFLIWELIVVVGIVMVIGGGIYADAHWRAPAPNRTVGAAETPEPVNTATPTPTPSPTRRLLPTAAALPQISVDANSDGLADPGQSGEQLDEGYLYVVLRDGTVYHGPMRFDPATVPPGSTVIMTELLAQEAGGDTAFSLNILPEIVPFRQNQPHLAAAFRNTQAQDLPAVIEAAFQVGGQERTLILDAGQRIAVEERLQTSHLAVASLDNLFPGVKLKIADGNSSGIQEQESGQLPTLPDDEAATREAGPPSPTPTFVVVTSTPTPENLQTVAAVAPTIAYQANTTGTPTPIPENWVTPWVVTSTPLPQNQATAQFQLAEATAAAILYGTPTPPAANMITATPEPTETPTPVQILLAGELPPMTATPVPAALEPTPPIPAELMGKIAFKSDRTGQEEIYVINADGTGLAILTNRWPYHLARVADSFSADGRFRVFTKDMVRYKNFDSAFSDEVRVKRDDAPALYWYDSLYQAEELLTHFGAGIAYDGVWSPAREQIAFVSNDSGNDEIWVVNRDGSDLRQLTRDEFNWWDKHPSWSPDGQRLVFWSNRTGHGQIWVMDGDGNNLYSLSRTGFNDWDPVWIKYPGVPANAHQTHLPYTGVYDPAGADRNCSDFETEAEAQSFYLAAGGPYRDPHKLDRDNDGVACD